MESQFMTISNHDRINIENIDYCLAKFKTGQMCLMQLIGNIGGLFRALTSTPKEWNVEFFNCWADLESVYSRELEEGKLNAEEQNIIKNSIKKLEDLIQRALSQFEYTQDVSPSPAQALDDNWLYCPICIDAWESSDTAKRIVICPKCNNAFLNPRKSIS